MRETLEYTNAKIVVIAHTAVSVARPKKANNRKISINVKWEQQKEYIRAQLSDNKTGKIYKRRKIDVEPVFGFLKANLRFNRFTVRGKFKAKIEMGLALMAVNLRKYMQHTAAA